MAPFNSTRVNLASVIVFGLLVSNAIAGGAPSIDLQVTIDQQFITIHDNFFERIGIDFDFDIGDGVVQVEKDVPNGGIDLDVDAANQLLADAGTILPTGNPGPEFGGRLNINLPLLKGGGTLSEVAINGGLGITMPEGESGAMAAQGAVAIKVDVPKEITGPIVFETAATLTADIVEPTAGDVGFSAFVELVPDLDAIRFSGPEQRFNWSSNSLGPFGDLFSVTKDFSVDEGVLVFGGANTIQHEIMPADIVNGLLYYNTVTSVSLDNEGTAVAQIDATGSFSNTLRAITPGVTFSLARTIPEPTSVQLLAVFTIGLAMAHGRLRTSM
ncbi:MAG: hypothetical protein ACR2NU_05005 [Aeoliella sp.]